MSGAGQAAALEQAPTWQVDGARLFDALQATWNLLESSAGPRLETAHSAGLAVIIKEALANGRLTTRNQASDVADRRRVLKDLAQRFQASIDLVAQASALARPWVSAVLSGAASKPQLQSNVKTSTIQWDDEAESLIEGLSEAPNAYWHTRSGLAWN